MYFFSFWVEVWLVFVRFNASVFNMLKKTSNHLKDEKSSCCGYSMEMFSVCVKIIIIARKQLYVQPCHVVRFGLKML